MKEYRAMGLFTPDVNNLRDLYISSLKHALNSERQIVDKGLPAMIEKSTSPELKKAFQTHLTESREHVARLERILNARVGEADGATCKVTSSLISSAESNISDAANESIRDVILIAAGNQVEHHEIAVYGTLRTWAEVLGNNEDAAILEKTLHEEQHADELLTELSRQINVAAPVA
jgi:ferritin-like metal-binding protein YciE